MFLVSCFSASLGCGMRADLASLYASLEPGLHEHSKQLIRDRLAFSYLLKGLSYRLVKESKYEQSSIIFW